MKTTIQHFASRDSVQSSDNSPQREAAFFGARRSSGWFAFAALVAGLLLILFSPPSARATQIPVGCTGSGLGINLFTSSPDVHVGDTLYYSAYVFNGIPGSGRTVCDAEAIRAWITTPDGVSNSVVLVRTYLSQGQGDFYTDVVSYVVRVQDILPDGTVRATANDTGIIHQNDTDSVGGGFQGVNTQVSQPCINLAVQCVGSSGETGAITFSGTVTNCGNNTLVGVTVSNSVNGGLFQVTFITNLLVQQVATFSGSWVPLNPCLPSTATFTAQGVDQYTTAPRTVSSSASTTCQNTLAPGIKVTKTCPVQPVSPGQLLTFSGSVSNTGNMTLTNIVVVNNQPVANTAVFTLASLAPGAVANFTGSYLAPTNCSATDTLTATAASRCGDVVSSVASATCPILTAPQIAVTALCPVAPIVSGGSVTYSGTVQNTGNITLTNVVLVSDRPAANTTVLTVAALAPGASTNFTATYAVPPNVCSVTTTFSVTGRDICTLNSVTNTVAPTCPVLTAPAIGVTLACPIAPTVAGGLITYTGYVTNSGNVTLNNVTVVNFQANPSTVLTVPSLAAHASANFSASFTAPAEGCTVSSTVTATGSDNCSQARVTNSASATCTLLTTPGIMVTKVCPAKPVAPGQLLTYSGSVSNSGNVTLTNIMIVNDQPIANTLVFTAATLAPGAVIGFEGSYSAPTNCSVSDTLTATGRSVCGVAVTNTASATCPILTTPQITVALNCPETPIISGGIATYTGTVMNSGNFTLNNVTVSQSGQLPPSTSGLSGYWAFNEASGSSANDSSGNGNTGNIINATRGPGQSGNALIFNGSSAYVNITNSASVNFAGAMTMSAWIKPQATDGFRNILAHGYTTSPSAEVFLRIHGGRYEAGAFNGTITPELSVAVPAGDVGTWVHLAATFDGTTWTLYRNGVAIGSANSGTPTMTVNANWAVGARAGGGERYFNGMIDEVRLYNRALSGSEIATLSGSSLIYSAASLNSGASANFTFSIMADACSATASVVATGQDICSQLTVTNGASATCPVLTVPAIGVTLACPPVTASAGGLITYTGYVTNSGNVTLNNVVVVDNQANPSTVLTVPSLAAHAAASFSASFVAPVGACTVSSTVTATGSDNCSQAMVTNTASATCALLTTPGLIVTKVCPERPVTPGQLLTFSGSVSNTGNVILTNIVVVNNQPVANTLVFTAAILAPGQVTNFTGSYVAPTNCSVADTLTGTGRSVCGVAVTNVVTATCSILTTPQIVVTAACPVTPIVPGGSVTYSGTVQNTGNITLTNVVVLSDRPAANTVVFSRATLAPGVSTNFTATYTVPANVCSVTTTFSAIGNDICTLLSVTNTVAPTCPVLTAPAIGITLACPPVTASAGGLITYTGYVTNSGNVTLNNVVVVDNQANPSTVLTVPSLAAHAAASFSASFVAPVGACTVSSTVTATGSDNCSQAMVTNTASATCALLTTPGLIVTKVCPERPVTPGQLLTFSGSVSNTGNVILTNIVVVNNQPVANTLVFTAAILAPGQVTNFTGSYVAPTNCSVADTLTGTGRSVCGVAVTNVVTATCSILTTPQIVVTVACPVTPIVPGGSVTYSGTVQNTGNITLTNVVLVSDRPAVNTTVLTVAALAPGASTNFTATYAVPPNVCSVTTTFSVTGRDICTLNSVTNTVAPTCPVLTAPAIGVTLACPIAPTVAGGLITYTGYVTNSGNVTLNNVTVVNFQANPSTVLTVPSLAAHASANFSASFTAPAEGCTVSSTVTATGSDNCSQARVTNSASATCTLLTTPGIIVTKVCPIQPVSPGQLLTFSGSVSNTGNVILTNIVVLNSQPVANTPVFTVAILAPGQVTNFTGSYVAPTNCSVTDTLIVTGRSVCGVAVTNSASATCPILTAPAIVVTHSCPPTPPLQGGLLTFSGTVSNAGNITLTNIIVVNNWPAANTVVFTLASLAPGATASFTGSYLVPVNCCVAWSTIVASGQDCYGVTVADTDTTTCQVLTLPAITVTKVCSPGALRPGDLMTYGGTVRNSGNITLLNVTVVNNQPGNGSLLLGPIILAPGETADYTASYVVPADFCGGDTVTASGLDLCFGIPVASSVTNTCPIITTPRIAVTKHCPPLPTAHGGQLVFSGSVSNLGNVTLVNVFVINNQPTNGTPVIGPITLAPGASYNFTGSYTAPLVCCEMIDTLTALGQDRCSGSNVLATATAVCPTIYTPGIALVQPCPPNPLPMGSLYQFSGYVTNTGDAILTNVVVFSPHGINPPVLGPIDLAPGESEFYSGSYIVPSNICEVIITATSQETCKGTWVTNTTSCPVAVTTLLAVTQNCPANPVSPGGLLTYSGTVSNAGNITLVNVVVRNNLSGATPVFTAATLLPGAAANFTGSYLAPTNCSTTSTSTATGRSLCGVAVTNAVSTTCPVTTTPLVTLTQTCPARPAIPGGLLTYSGTVSNAGNITLTNVVVLNNLSLVVPVLTVATLAPGASANFTGSYVAPNDCSSTSISTATGRSICGVIVNSTLSSVCPIITAPGITITESCPPTPVTAGSSVAFVGSVTNIGNITLTNVFVFSSSSNGTPVLGPITLAPGASWPFAGSYIATGGSDPTTNYTIVTNGSVVITTNTTFVTVTNTTTTVITNPPTPVSFGTIDSVSQTVVDRFLIGSNFNGLTYAGEDHGYGATELYSMRKDITGTSFFDTIIPSTATTTDRFAASSRNFDALAYAAPDLGYGPVIFYYLSHDNAGVSTFGTIIPGGTVGVVADHFVVGTNFDALTFAATDVGYGANLFYYVRHDANGLSTFGTINPALPGMITDRFTVGTNVDALVFTDLTAPGYGADNFYYLRHDANRVSTFGTIHITGLNTATVTDRFTVGTNATELTFTATDTAFGPNLFYFLRGRGLYYATNTVTNYVINTVITYSTNTVNINTTNSVVTFTPTNTVTATGLDVCQGRTVVATANCFGIVGPLMIGAAHINTDGFFGLPFATEKGKTYTVQYKNTLSDPTWTDLPGMPVAGTGETMTIMDPTAAGQPSRFYRIMSTP